MAYNRSNGVPATLVARAFYELAEKRKNEGKDVIEPTPLHLIKWSYIANGWAYPEMGRRLIADPVEAWQYGPVYSELYHLIKNANGKSVDFVPFGSEEQSYPKTHDGNHLELDDEERKLIKDVYEVYGQLSGSRLISITHEKGGPWDLTEPAEPEINQNVIRQHFNELAKVT